jgi:plasmid stabilization system protein ParE
MKRFDLQPRADRELNESAGYYDEQVPGLGDRFLDEFLALMRRLLDHPRSGTVVEDEIRVARFRGFPYDVYYQIEETRLVVLAITAQRREPGTWKRDS